MLNTEEIVKVILDTNDQIRTGKEKFSLLQASDLASAGLKLASYNLLLGQEIADVEAIADAIKVQMENELVDAYMKYRNMKGDSGKSTYSQGDAEALAKKDITPLIMEHLEAKKNYNKMKNLWKDTERLLTAISVRVSQVKAEKFNVERGFSA